MLHDARSFRPMKAMFYWIELRTTARRLSAAIVLPTGVKVGDFTTRVVSGRAFIEFRCRWPKEVINVYILHRKWLTSQGEDRIHDEYVRISRILKFLKCMMRQSNASVESVYRIPALLPMETHIYSS